MSRPDPHSYTDDTQPRVTSFDWRARLDFGGHRLECELVLELDPPNEPASAARYRDRGGPLDLDSRELDVAEVRVVDPGSKRATELLRHELADPDPVLGERLRVHLPAGATAIWLRYRTATQASALQWLTPEQTAGRGHPYLFSQCQAIHARSILPLQDTPARRVTYKAALTIPSALRSLMAAASDTPGRVEHGETATERWHMPQPIPPYLVALAVGNLVSRDLSPRCRVWAEPEMVERAAREFDGVEAMISAAEGLFGPYDWERFDLLVMPPSFPYGGMENPRLTFLTPTLIAGDRSLVNVVAHELAHSWTGNLVTNSSAEHFWLNEGFTVYAERRILEETAGPEAALLAAALGRRELERAVAEFSEHPEWTRLRTHLQGVDPDEVFSVIPYEKGYLLLRALEEHVGRPRWDDFVKAYMRAYRFRSLTTEEFTAFVDEHLPGALEAIRAAEYLDAAGVPAHAPAATSARLDTLFTLATSAEAPSEELARSFSPTEWQIYLERLPRPLPLDRCRTLDGRFGLGRSTNYEILVGWLVVAAHAVYEPARARTLEVLGEVGRMKYLRPLYQALAQHPETADLARATFERCRPGYHPIAAQVIERILRS